MELFNIKIAVLAEGRLDSLEMPRVTGASSDGCPVARWRGREKGSRVGPVEERDAPEWIQVLISK